MRYLFLIIFLFPLPVSAAEDCTTLGWHFYCDPEEPAAPEAKPAAPEAEPVTPMPLPAPVSDAREQIKKIQDKLNGLKAEAIINPTPENLIAYISFQREQLDRASTFSDQWRRVIWQNPEMDYDLIRPTGTLAKRAWSDERKLATANTLANLSNRYGVFYFFKGNDCSQCQAFETSLKPFTDKHGLHVMAITLDGIPSSTFPASIPDSGQAARLGITGEHLPALALFDTETSQVIPVGFGALAADEMERRIFILTQVEVGNDY